MAARRYWLLLVLETANLVVEPSKLQMSCTFGASLASPCTESLSSPVHLRCKASEGEHRRRRCTGGLSRILSFSKYISKELSLAAGWHEKEVSIFLLAFHAIHRVSLYSLSHYCERGLTLIPRVTFIR